MAFDPAADINTLADAVRRDPDSRAPWRELAWALAIRGEARQAIDVLAQRQMRSQDASSLYYDVLGMLIDCDPVAFDRLLECLPDTHLFQPMAHIFRAYQAVQQERSDAAITALRQAIALLPQVKNALEQDAEFMSRLYPLLINQTEQLALSSELSIFAEPEPPLAVTFAQPSAGGAAGVVAASADSVYLTRFAESFARSFYAFQPQGIRLHLHVIDPDATAEATIERLCRLYPDLAISREHGQLFGTKSVYYACNRFLIADRLIAHYGPVPLMLTDIDLTVLAPISQVIAGAEDSDIALFETGNCAPQLRCSAAFVRCAPTPGGILFLDRIRRYLGLMLRADRKWMLDQAALWSLTRGLKPLNYSNLTALHGKPLDGFFLPFSDDGSKREQRHRVDG
jgi:tetratricopeptide (TPR) repeat protein